jgi:hypothetical protein
LLLFCTPHSAEMRHWTDDLKGTDQIRIDRHDGSSVIELATIIGSTEDGYQLTIRLELVTILDNLINIIIKKFNGIR